MADFKAALYAFLASAPALTAQVGTRIYPMIAPATAPMPYITYQRIDAEQEGYLLDLSELTHTVYQFDVWGAAPLSAEHACLALKATLDRYRGLMGTIPVRQCRVTSILDGMEEPVEGATQGDWRHTLTVDFWFAEP